MKKLIPILLALMALSACNSKKADYQVAGTIKNAPKTPVFLEDLSFTQATQVDVDTTDETGKFSMSGFTVKPGIFRLRIGQDKTWLFFFDNKPEVITADANDPQHYTVEGSPETNSMQKLMADLGKIQQNYMGIQQQMQQAQASGNMDEAA